MISTDKNLFPGQKTNGKNQHTMTNYNNNNNNNNNNNINKNNKNNNKTTTIIMIQVEPPQFGIFGTGGVPNHGKFRTTGGPQ